MAFSEAVLLSTTDLAAVNIALELRASSRDSLKAIVALLPPGDPPRLLLSPRDDVRPEDVVLSELLNQRGPAAWLAAPSAGSGAEGACEQDAGAAALSRLAQRCISRGTVLVLMTLSTFDLVLVPRAASVDDGVGFVMFATRLEGVRFIARTIADKKVAVVLDLDSTLLESEHLPVQPPDWRELPWQTVSLRQEPSGQAVMGRVSRLPDESHHAETVHAATWVWKGASHNYRVRQRLGWSHLRDLLIQEGHHGGKLATYVLSLGRPLYIQTCWNILDPRGLIIAQHEFKKKVNSARPDGVYWVPEKTPCIGVGLRSVFDPDFNMRLGPLWIADDIPDVFMEKYRDAVFGVPAYKPVAGLPNDYDADGGVLRGMAGAIMQFWQHCYGADGSSGVVAAAARAAQTTLHQLCNMPLEGAGEWCEGHFKEQEAIGSAMSVQTFLEQQQMAATVQDAVPAALFVPENDENKPQPKAAPPSAEKMAAPVLPERVLRPSSRQDNMGPSPPAHLHGKAGAAAQQQQQHAAPPASGEPQISGIEPPEYACGSTHDVASISIVPECDSASGDQHRLVLLLASTGAQPEAATGPGGAAEGSIAVAIESAGCSGGLDACPVEVVVTAGGTEVEDEEVFVAGVPEEAMDESWPQGRKRDFAAISGQDGMPGSAGPTCLPAIV